MGKFMKTIKKALLFVLLITLNIACYQDFVEEDSSQNVSNPIIIKGSISKPYTRVLNNNFELNDSIGLYMLVENDEVHFENTVFKYSAKGTFLPLQESYYPNKGESKIISYYPHNKATILNDNSITCSIKKNQNSHLDYSLSDFLISYKEKVKSSNKAIELRYNHGLARLDLELKISAPYSAEDLKTINPTIRIKNSPIQAQYNYIENRAYNHSGHTVIAPFTKWSVKGNNLIGSRVILLPDADFSKQTIQVEAENLVYECNLPTDFILKSGTINKLIINFTPSIGIEVGVIQSDINDWDEGDEWDTSANIVDTLIPIHSLNFNNSKILNLQTEDGLICAKVCKELLKNDSIETSAIVLYPLKENINELINGVILDIDLKNTSQYIAGSIKWQGNSFTIEPSEIPYIKYIFVDHDDNIVFKEPENPKVIKVQEDQVLDIRPEEIKSYPKVKVANQVWMAKNLSTSYFTNGDKLAYSKNEYVVQPGYAIFEDYPNQKLYNDRIVEINKDICPKGWKIPTYEVAQDLLKYIDNNSTLIINSVSSKEDKSNLSGLGLTVTGIYSNKYNSSMSAIWLVFENNNAANISFIDNNQWKLNKPNTENDSKRMASIRCIKE